MKTTKRFAGLLLALVLLLAMTIPAFAEQEGELNGGTITIENAVPGETYNAYQILYLESYHVDNVATGEGQYAYRATSAWKTWLQTNATEYFEFDGREYVTWKKDADAAVFAKLAQDFAATLPKADATAAAPDAAEGEVTSTVTLSNLKLGYYLVDTSLGSLCSLDTTNPSVIMKEKNAAPSIDKLVQEDSKIPGEGQDDNSWSKSNTAQIGDTVNFKIIVHAKKGAQNYVVHDKMSDGLTLKADSIVVMDATHGSNYTVATDVKHYKKDAEGNPTNEVDYICAFEITFMQDYLDTITTDTDITITYSALLNEKAVTTDAGNTNSTKLNYGDKSSTEWDQTVTKTFEFDIIKTNSKLEVLNGAEFELYNAKGNKISLVKNEDGTYRVATDAEKSAEGFTSAVIEAGKTTVKGLDADTTYYLEETKQPDGYNKLADRVEVAIGDKNVKSTMTGNTWAQGDGGIQITNKTGAELPSTGGIGTTVFYIVGGVLLVGAGVLLVVRKRMSTGKESNK